MFAAGQSMRRRFANLAQGALTVTIQRLNETPVEDVAARIGQTDYETDVVGVGIVSSRDLDFIVAAADYDFGSGQVEPQSGDVIISGHTGSTKQYRVGPRQGLAPFEPHDSRGLELRIHTRQIDADE